MPSGRTHDRITLWLLPWVVGLSLLITRRAELTLLMAGGFLFSGLMFGPDLDIYSIQYQRWGVLRLIWWPYRSLLRHRSWLSHGPIVGTTLRIVYFLAFLLFLGGIILGIVQLIWGTAANWLELGKKLVLLLVKQYPHYLIALGVGLELGSLSHALSDSLGSSLKKRRRKKSR
jgi:uncharacterized metal-binding protein